MPLDRPRFSLSTGKRGTAAAITLAAAVAGGAAGLALEALGLRSLGPVLLGAALAAALVAWRRAARRAPEESLLALRRSRDQFRELFEHSVHGIVVQRELRVLYVNLALVEMLGYGSADEILERGSLLELLAPHEHERARLQDAALRAGDAFPSHGEWSAIRRDAVPLTVSSSARLVAWDGEPATQCTLLDVTERKQVESELMQVSARALTAAHAKSEFLANMSHELRTPLNGIIGMLELLRETELGDAQAEYVEVARSSGEALLALIGDILDFSQVESGAFELKSADFDLRASVEAVVERLAAGAHAKGLELAALIDETIRSGHAGDRIRLEQVLTNLVANAIKFTASGEVVVTVEPSATRGRRTRLRFEVRDTGIGIPAAAQERIFGAFTQADSTTTRQFGGTGLGLAISRRLVERMQGEIGVRSAPGEGATFWFEAWFDPPAIPLAAVPAPFAGRAALVLDTWPPARESLARHLRAHGLAVSCPAPGDDWEGDVDPPRPFDVVFLHDGWPEPSTGESRLERLRHHPACRQARIVLTTPLRAEYLSGGAHDAWLPRPVRRTRVGELLAGLFLGAGSRGHTRRLADIGSPASPDDARILVVEDNQVNRRVTVAMLAAMGYAADVAVDGSEAIPALAQGAYDLVLMDCQMPVLDGFDATRRIRASAVGIASIPVIALTASASGDDLERCLAAGMDDYITKPLRPEALRAVLARWLPASAA